MTGYPVMTCLESTATLLSRKIFIVSICGARRIVIVGAVTGPGSGGSPVAVVRFAVDLFW